VAINDIGQIVINDNNNVYLLTPLPPPQTSTPLGAYPPYGSGLNQTMTFTFNDPRGWQDLDVVNVLINNFLDGRNACYLAHSRSADVLYLVNDAGSVLSAGLVFGSSGSVSNSQCSVAGIGSSASGNGNTLTLTLNLSFTTSFGGNKVVYMAARDLAANNSGWQPLGVWQIPGCAPSPFGMMACISDPNSQLCKAFGGLSPVLGPPCSWTGTIAVIGMSPANGRGSTQASTYTFTFSDSKGYQDLGVVNILANTALDGRQACYLAYSRPYNVLYLVNDAGTALLPGKSLGTQGTLQNGQCTVTWGSNPVAASGNTLALSLNIGFSTAFGPNLIFYLAARDGQEANNTGWQSMGTWAVTVIGWGYDVWP
jgi:hypothetical protein